MPFNKDNRNQDTSVTTNKFSLDNENVPPEHRRKTVLAFIEEHDMALPPLAIYAGLKRQQNITFSSRTVQYALADLVDDASLMRVDTQSLRDNGQIERVDDGGGRRSYYFITESGRERLRE